MVQAMEYDMGYSKKKKRTTQEIILTVLLVLALAAIVVLVVVLVLELQKKDEPQNIVVRNELYVNEAGRMMRSMNVSVDPCEDFWQYACGGYIADNADLPDTEFRSDIFISLDKDVKNYLRKVLGEPMHSTDIESEIKAKDYYQSCLNEDVINGKGGKPLLDLLDDLGTWPVLNETWDENSLDINDLMAKLAIMTFQNLGRPDTFYDIRNASFDSLYVSQPEIPFRDLLAGSGPVAQAVAGAYHNVGVSVAKLLGGGDPADDARIQQDMEEMFDLEIDLAKITMSKAETADFNTIYNPMTLGDLQTNYPQLWDWEVYLPAVMSAAHVNLAPESRLIMTTVDYFSELDTTLRHYSNRTIVNYLLWNVVYQMYPFLSAKYTALEVSLNQLTSGTSTEVPRWNKCVDLANILFPSVLGRMHSEENFPAVAKQDTLAMVDDLKAAFHSIVEAADWMDSETRSRALNKLEVMGVAVGYPDYIMDDTKLNEKYALIHISRDEFFQNTVRALTASKVRTLTSYSQPFDDSKWPVAPATINAVFIPTENRIMFPAAILQKHFYNSKYPRFMNYGGIGAIIGHEITHGFDNTGRQFDEFGDLADWWTPGTADKFNEKTKCLVDQYSQYRYEDLGKNVDGNLTLGENIADNAGIKEAYMAYRSWVSKNGEEEASLPGLEYLTNDQVFFLSWAQDWCQVIRPAAVSSNLVYDNHTPNQYRLIGTMQNSVEFSAAFNCPSGSYMNPTKKCEVW